MSPTLVWSKGNPDNWQNSEHCASIIKQSGFVNLNDVSCNTPIRFICEVSQRQQLFCQSFFFFFLISIEFEI
jgi:hypothetical protein